MIIPNMYNTQIKVYSDSGYTTPSYNINIDGNAYIKVIIKDFNGDPVTDEPVTLYYDDNTVVGTPGTTNSEGVWTTSYTCSEWGIHTFSTNNTSIQIKVDGWKYIQTGSLFGASILMYRNKYYGYITSQSTASTLPSGASTLNNMFPSQLIPAMTVTLKLNYGPDHNYVLIQNGDSSMMTNIANNNRNFTQFGLMYPLKNP